MLSSQVPSAAVGLLLSNANYIGFRSKLAEPTRPPAPTVPAWKRRLWHFLAWFDLIAFPLAGDFIPTIFSSASA